MILLIAGKHESRGKRIPTSHLTVFLSLSMIPFVQTGHQLCTSVVAHKWMLPRCIVGLLDKNRFKAVNESQQWSKKHPRG